MKGLLLRLACCLSSDCRRTAERHKRIEVYDRLLAQGASPAYISSVINPLREVDNRGDFEYEY